MFLSVKQREEVDYYMVSASSPSMSEPHMKKESTRQDKRPRSAVSSFRVGPGAPDTLYQWSLFPLLRT